MLLRREDGMEVIGSYAPLTAVYEVSMNRRNLFAVLLASMFPSFVRAATPPNTGYRRFTFDGTQDPLENIYAAGCNERYELWLVKTPEGLDALRLYYHGRAKFMLLGKLENELP